MIPHREAAPATRRLPLLFVLAGNMLIDALEVSVVLPALPSAAGDLGLSAGQAQWMMGGFALGFAALLLLGPRVTALFGRRRVYLAALAVFVVASAVGGVAEGGAAVVATRVVKGACAALTAPAGLAIIATAFPHGPLQRRAVSVYSFFGAAGFTVGLLLSGPLTAFSWRWTLLFPAAAALLLLPFAWRLIPEGQGGGPLPPVLVKRSLLADRRLVRSAVGAATLNGANLALLLTVVFVLQVERNWEPWQTAVALLPTCVPLVGSALFSGRMVERFGTEGPIALGALAAALGWGWQLAGPGPAVYGSGLLPTLLLTGAAFALAFGPLNMQATADVPAEDRGLAVPLYQTGVQLGAVVALTSTGALLSRGSRPALVSVAALGALGLAVALAGLRERHRDSQRERNLSC
ncbi:MFS transporter [Streptomyces spectabilis]|uniref:MFS transporter n=1 Tax=Streptomyces spectabilis TaxID=68270 RepID=UPI0033EAC9BF